MIIMNLAKVFTALLSLVSLLGTVQSQEQLHDGIEWEIEDIQLPLPLSDLIATYMPGAYGDEDGYIILTGGCDDPLGNHRDPDIDLYVFFCTSVTNATLRFDPFNNTITELAAAPHARYRHAATALDGKLYVFGGRDVEDNIVPEVDMYDAATNEWTTIGTLPEDLATSDQGAWTWQNYVYVAGGFEPDYTASGVTFRLDMVAMASNMTESLGVLQVEAVSSMNVPRGDFHPVVVRGYAYMAGGITHANNWCTSLRDFERYHMATDTWETLDDLTVGRADMAVAVLNGKIVATGGETKPPDCATLLDPAFGSLPQDDVEVFFPPDGRNKAEWVSYSNFPDERFRFGAASVPALNSIYTFGGQLPFNETCQCFPSSNVIAVAYEKFDDPQPAATGVTAPTSAGGMGGGAVAGIAIACSAASLVAGLVIGRALFAGSKASPSAPTVVTSPAPHSNVFGNEVASEADSSVNPKIA